MKKEDILKHIQTLASKQEITKHEIDEAFEAGKGKTKVIGGFSKVGINEILYYLGGAIVLIGIVVLIYQNWHSLGITIKLLATLGAGLVAFTSGVLLTHADKKFEKVAQAFFLISAPALHIGIFVAMDHAGMNAGTDNAHILSAGIMSALYLGAFAIFRSGLFVIFSTIFVTWFFVALTNKFDPQTSFGNEKFFEYRALVVGLTYLLLGYFFSSTKLRILEGAYYFFGIIIFLGAALALGGYKPSQSIFWELFFPVLCFWAILLSPHLKSTSLLGFGTVFLIGFIGKITAEYFSDSLGWPLALVIAGFAIIGISYFSFTVKQKYS